MINEKEIKRDLKDIRFYYENYEMFCNAVRMVGENRIVKTVENTIKRSGLLRQNCIKSTWSYTVKVHH